MEKKILFIYLILLGILSVSCYSGYMVWKHYDLYANDPLVYGAEAYDVNSCFCTTNDGREFRFDQNVITRVIKSKDPNKNYEVINLTLLEK